MVNTLPIVAKLRSFAHINLNKSAVFWRKFLGLRFVRARQLLPMPIVELIPLQWGFVEAVRNNIFNKSWKVINTLTKHRLRQL